MIKRSVLAIVLLWYVTSLPVIAQDEPFEELIRADFVASTQTPLVGEPIEIRFVVEFPTSVIVVEYPQFAEEWGSFMLVNTGEPSIIEEADGGSVYEQVLDARLWETGDFQTPETFVRYHVVGSDAVFSVPVKPAFFSVPSVLETRDLNRLELRPLKPQIGFFVIPLWFFVVLVVVIALGTWYGYGWLVRRRLAAELAMHTDYTPYEMTLNELVQLQEMDMDPYRKSESLSDALRRYLSKAYPSLNRDLTTSELMDVIRANGLWDETRTEQLRRILEQADLTKYAQYETDERMVARLLGLAYHWLSSVQQRQSELQHD